MNEGDIRQMTHEQLKRALLFPIRFNNDFYKLMEPYKKYEVIK